MNKKQIGQKVKRIQLRTVKKNFKNVNKAYKNMGKAVYNSYLNDENLYLGDFKNDMSDALNNNAKNSLGTLDMLVQIHAMDIKKEQLESVKNKFLTNFAKNYVSGRVDSIHNTVDTNLRKLISNEIDSGSGTQEIAHKLLQKCNQYSVGSALTVARTETSYVINTSTHDCAVESDMKNKEWVHVGGGYKDRPSHVDMDGETQLIDEPFSNGLQHPHEDGADASEVINCYCICVYE